MRHTSVSHVGKTYLMTVISTRTGGYRTRRIMFSLVPHEMPSHYKSRSAYKLAMDERAGPAYSSASHMRFGCGLIQGPPRRGGTVERRYMHVPMSSDQRLAIPGVGIPQRVGANAAAALMK